MAMNERKIKLLLLQRFMDEPPDFIGSEIPFAHGKRRLDLLTVNGDRSHVYEIKSERDSLRRLDQQLEDYLRTFNFTTIVCTNRHLRECRKVGKAVGIILVEDQLNLVWVRKPRGRMRLDKESLASLIVSSDIRSLSSRSDLENQISPSSAIGEVREYLTKYASTEKLSSIALDCLTSRYADRYRAFLANVGNKVTREELEILSKDIYLDF